MIICDDPLQIDMLGNLCSSFGKQVAYTNFFAQF